MSGRHPRRRKSPAPAAATGSVAGNRTVLLTGATGNWGRATLRAFREHPDIVVKAFVLPTRADRAALQEFHDMENLEIVEGDLTRFDDVRAAVTGSDVVLHLAAVVSPHADARPEEARRVNVGSMRNIVRAVHAQPDPARVAVVGVGSVAQSGDRPEPVHWGRVGDPLRPSLFDEYAQSKIVAERLLVDSGLPRWAWLRQTGILHSGVLAVRDPIMTHVPLSGVMEWVSAEDSARLLVAVCAAQVPEEFWGGIHNVGGGAAWRLTNWKMLQALAAGMGADDIRGWYDRNWFALQNFHGQWFTDSDRLEALVPFRRDTVPEALARVWAGAPAAARLAGTVPAWLVKHLVMRPLVRRHRGTMHAVRTGDEAALRAHFGGLDAWQRIGGWDAFTPPAPSRTPKLLDHGYDEGKPRRRIGRRDLRQAAVFRGGSLLTGDVRTGDLGTPLVWRCGFGHVFAASPRLVLLGGHWCPECVADPASYPAQAAHNRFLAQIVDRSSAAVRPDAVSAADAVAGPDAVSDVDAVA
ncbi:NAD(P)-dependent oxidoreductase [Microbacterium sp. p3-SID336]|uniref:NAD-dependent epimerase/dehydratase family protein n=1 Tax=Microbacterium sp. p3-SID336 TaxID=2916212 RepID=UPI0021A5FC65|nr:NAD(P)-dependent oxidoreductase [Microbacterium sp. p3-SID336]MCT1478590.1 NAD(P)-dependent oxidoreductase [Microbacterium sp. p3-SID336]